MDEKPQVKRSEPLVEIAPEESVLPALSQSAHPVEFIESNKSADDVAEGDATKQEQR